MRKLRLAPQRLSMANTEPRMMLGNRRLSKDDWTAMLMVLDAIDGDIPAVRKAAQKLRRSGKGVEEAVAAVKDRQYSGRGPLHMAAWAGRLEMCKFLVKDLRLNVDAPGDEGTCEIAELLLSRGAYVDPMCRRGTPLHIAAQSGNAGADANAGRPFQPLVIAAAHGFIDFINCLLEAGADPNVPGQDPVFGEHDGWALKEQEDAALEENSRFALKMQEDATFESMVLKMQGDAAFEENAYAYALVLYTKAMEADPDDSTLYAKRSLCWLHLSEEDKALDDANTYKAMEMDLSNSCYEQAAALVLTKEYAQACQALMSGLKLDLRSDDLD
ncbi:hypothetical protein ACQ4PT_068223 [Festuca glaucescens]